MASNDPNAQGALVNYLNTSFNPNHEPDLREKLTVGWHRVHVRDAPPMPRSDSYFQYNSSAPAGNFQGSSDWVIQQQFPNLHIPINNAGAGSFYAAPGGPPPGNTSSGSSHPTPPFSS